MQPGESTTLVRRNIALAIGWLLALMTFAVCWFISERSPSLVAGLVVVFTAILFLWWPWKLAVIGWLIVPAITAALLATSRYWYRSEEHTSELQSLTNLVCRLLLEKKKQHELECMHTNTTPYDIA